MSRRWARARWMVATLVWLGAMVGASAALWRYKSKAGAVRHEAPAEWPGDLSLTRAQGTAAIVMLAHPKCPCTRASIGELSRLMTRVGSKAVGYVLFMVPPAAQDGWERTDTWTRAAAIPGVRVLVDRGGAVAARFGATTSGHTVVYDGAGKLIFSGGITPARGHFGDTPGQAHIVASLASRSHAAGDSPTFGCELD